MRINPRSKPRSPQRLQKNYPPSIDALQPLARTSHRPSTAAADPGASTALRFLGLLDILSSMPAGPFVARLVSMPICAASLRNPVRNAGQRPLQLAGGLFDASTRQKKFQDSLFCQAGACQCLVTLSRRSFVGLARITVSVENPCIDCLAVFLRKIHGA